MLAYFKSLRQMFMALAKSETIICIFPPRWMLLVMKIENIHRRKHHILNLCMITEKSLFNFNYKLLCLVYSPLRFSQFEVRSEWKVTIARARARARALNMIATTTSKLESFSLRCNVLSWWTLMHSNATFQRHTSTASGKPFLHPQPLGGCSWPAGLNAGLIHLALKHRHEFWLNKVHSAFM
jgi:hypothetical protein